MNIIAILLSAGLGSRFGGGKLLHPWADGVPIGAHAARNLRAAGLPVVAVVKPGDSALAEILEQQGCEVVVCAQAARGMGASLACGIGAHRNADAWIVALADMPSIKSTTIEAIARELAAGQALVAPAYQGARGHPVGLSQRFATQLAALDGDAGARDILAAHKSEMVLIECGDPGVLLDIDQRADLTKT